MKMRKGFITALVLLMIFTSCHTVPATHSLDDVQDAIAVISQDADNVSTSNQGVIEDLGQLEKQVPAEHKEAVQAISAKAEKTQSQIVILQADIQSASAKTVEAQTQVSRTENDLVKSKKANGVLIKWLIGLAICAVAGIGLTVWRLVR